MMVKPWKCPIGRERVFLRFVIMTTLLLWYCGCYCAALAPTQALVPAIRSPSSTTIPPSTWSPGSYHEQRKLLTRSHLFGNLSQTAECHQRSESLVLKTMERSLTFIREVLRRSQFARKWNRFACKLQGAARRSLVILCFVALIQFSIVESSEATGGGRMGGSFGRSSSSTQRVAPRSSSPRSSSRYGSTYRHRQPYYHQNRHYDYHRPGIRMGGPTSLRTMERPIAQKHPTTADLLVVAGTGTIITMNVLSNRRENGGASSLRKSGPLGSGTSVLSLTVAVNVANRKSPKSPLSKLKQISQNADTSTRKGVQALMQESALELLRGEDAVDYCESTSENFRKDTAADQAYANLSVAERSKFSYESVSNYGGKKEQESSSASEIQDSATMAVVTLLLCIEGDSTMIPKVRNREQLRESLSKIAADVQVGECVLAGEVLWSPADDKETLTERDVIAKYPTLLRLLD